MWKIDWRGIGHTAIVTNTFLCVLKVWATVYYQQNLWFIFLGIWDISPFNSYKTVPPQSPQLIPMIKPCLRNNPGLWPCIPKYHSHPSQSSWTNIFWGNQMVDTSLAHPVSTLGFQQPFDRFLQRNHIGAFIHMMACRAAGWQVHRPPRRTSGGMGQRAF